MQLLILVEHVKGFITLGPGVFCCYFFSSWVQALLMPGSIM